MGENVSLIDGHDDEVKKSCNDCLHNEICLEQYKGLNQEMMFRECKRFKAKENLVEVKHGYWKQTQEPLGWQDLDCVECSICHESFICDEDFGYEDFKELWKYCPNCGAKMDGERRGKE